MSSRPTPFQKVSRDESVLITGGAGFIGTNLAVRLLNEGCRVLLFDNFSRRGVEHNISFLKQNFGERAQVIEADVGNHAALRAVVAGVAQVFHFAAQVAVTTSLADPMNDFETNARGTINLLEALRRENPNAGLVFTSTNKVYGHLDDLRLLELERSYTPAETQIARYGISEAHSIQFHSPYGCSKGAADQYVLDYARTFGLRAAVFRMSCIYGPHQCGNEDQGWVAHFVKSALLGQPITLYGDGRQVRDLLYVDDLVDAFQCVQANMDSAAGKVYNIGGGPQNAVSLLEVLELIEELRGNPIELIFRPWRTADQRYYVSDIRHFSTLSGWAPKFSAREGIRRLHRWMEANRVPIAEEPLPEMIDHAENIRPLVAT